MGFSQKDLGDVVWSSETGRDSVFLTSRPKTRSTQQTLPRIHPGRTHIAFDDHHLVPDAGLLLPAILARHLGLPQLVDLHLNQSQGEMYISLDRTIGAHPVGA